VARLLEISVLVAWHAPVCLGQDNGELADSAKGTITRSTASTACRDQHARLHRWQQMVGVGEIIRLSTGQDKTNRIAEYIDQHMNFGAQSATRAPDRLILADFLWVPALC